MVDRRPLIAVLWLFLPLAPLMLSGVVRSALGASMGVSFAVSTALTAILLVLHRRTLALGLPRGRHTLPFSFGAVAALALGVFLHSPELGALVTVGGGDAGNHVSIQQEFVGADPKAYSGFITFHAATWLLQRALGIDPAQSFALAFYLIVSLVPLCAAGVAASLLHDLPRRAWLVSLGVLALLFGAGVLRIWGPWLHYQQADGFYAHAFGLLPLLFSWCAYSVATTPFWRATVLVGFVVLTRFTYGLNLGDCLIAAAVGFALEARHSTRRPFTFALWLAAILSGGAAIVAYRALSPLRFVIGGSVVAADVRQLLIAQALLVFLLGAAWWQSRRGSDPVAMRLAQLPLLFGATSLVIQLLCVATRSPQRYYFLKYNLLPVLFMSIAVVALLPALVGRIVERKAMLRWAIPVLATALAALTLIANATHPHWFTFRERAWGSPPYRHVEAIFDPAWASHIREVLSRDGRVSGGLLDPSWPRSNFMNASLGSYDAVKEGLQRFAGGTMIQTADTCVFWLEGDSVEAQFASIAPELGTALRSSWDALRSAPDKQCTPHHRAWAPDPALHACYRCGPG